MRLRRLRPEALYKEEARQLTVPLRPDEAPVEALTELLQLLVPRRRLARPPPWAPTSPRPRAVGAATRPGRGRAGSMPLP